MIRSPLSYRKFRIFAWLLDCMILQNCIHTSTPGKFNIYTKHFILNLTGFKFSFANNTCLIWFLDQQLMSRPEKNTWIPLFDVITSFSEYINPFWRYSVIFLPSRLAIGCFFLQCLNFFESSFRMNVQYIHYQEKETHWVR